MTELRKAAEMALEALEGYWYGDNDELYADASFEAMSALRQALNVDETAKREHEWVGLTDEEREHFRGLGFVGVLAVEAKLKEKNT